MNFSESLTEKWHSQLQQDYPNHSDQTRGSLVNWLLGENPQRLDELTSDQQFRLEQGLNFRYQILRQRYLEVSPEQGYRNLMKRLGGLVILRQKIQIWVATSRDRQRETIDVLQEVIQEMLNSDRYLQEQMQWIAECTADKRLRNSLLLANIEEYCLRPIRNQPLLVYRFVNYLRRVQRGGLTQVPSGEWVRQLSDEVLSGEQEEPVSLLEDQAISQYEESQYFEEQQTQRLAVQGEFEKFLAENVDPQAAEWLRLYVRGYSQEAIAQKLNMPIKQVYRLREKVSYHAVRNFTLKQAPELVTSWLGTSLSEHRFGLNSTQWQQFWERLNPNQRQLLELMKAGNAVDAIAKSLNLKQAQVHSEWSKVYLLAQEIRNAEKSS